MDDSDGRRSDHYLGWTMNVLLHIDRLFEAVHGQPSELYRPGTTGEWVVAAAIRYEGDLFIGTEHMECEYNLEKLGLNAHDQKVTDGEEFGFYTNLGRFVDREEAFHLARKSGQVKSLNSYKRMGVGELDALNVRGVSDDGIGLNKKPATESIDRIFEDDTVYEGTWRGKPAWAGVADIDGTVISAVSYFKASQSDFHHSHYLRPEDADGMEEKTRIFWVVLYGKVDLDWMAYGGAEYPAEDKARLIQHITSQISPIKPAENLPKYLRSR